MSPVLYLYALVDGEPSGPLGEGLAGEPLRLLPRGGVAVVAGDLPERPRPDRETLERQDAVVRRLAERFGAILPARFGEAFADEAALAGRLDPREPEIALALALVRGCVQMTLRVFGEPEPVPRSRRAPPEVPARATSPPGGGSASGRARSPRSTRCARPSAPCSAPSGSSATPHRAPWSAPPITSSSARRPGPTWRPWRRRKSGSAAAASPPPARGPPTPSLRSPRHEPARCGPPGDRGSRRPARRDRASGRGDAPRWNADPEEVQKSVAKLVLALVEFLRKLMEKQAIRRMEAGTLTDEEVENVGLALMKLEETLHDIAARFGLEADDLNLDLGPLGRLI